MLTPIDPQQAAETLAEVPNVSPELRRISQRMARLFALSAPQAPGLALIGAVLALNEGEQASAGIRSISVTGNGLSAAQALTTCFGEAADTLSQFERRGDLVAARRAPKLLSGWIGQAAEGADSLDWVLGHDARTGEALLVPADVCLRRPEGHRAFGPVGALSSGCAAGPDLDHARTRAVLELIERDAAALWWLGGRQGAALPPLPAVDALLLRLRGGSHSPHAVLLDITSDIGVPVVAACSHDGEGLSFACGVACRASLAEAATAALLEMAQMEMSAPVALMKAKEQGDAALNPADRRHIARAALPVADLPMLRPRASRPEPAQRPRPAAQLAAKGCQLAFVDLTRPDIGVPVTRAVSPDLQPFSDSIVTPRLAAAIAETGGGERHHGGVMPF